MVSKRIEIFIAKANESGKGGRVLKEVYDMVKNLREVFPIHRDIKIGRKTMIHDVRYAILNSKVKENIRVLKYIFNFTDADFEMISDEVSDKMIANGEI